MVWFGDASASANARVCCIGRKQVPMARAVGREASPPSLRTGEPGEFAEGLRFAALDDRTTDVQPVEALHRADDVCHIGCLSSRQLDAQRRRIAGQDIEYIADLHRVLAGRENHALPTGVWQTQGL